MLWTSPAEQARYMEATQARIARARAAFEANPAAYAAAPGAPALRRRFARFGGHIGELIATATIEAYSNGEPQ